MTIVDGCDHGYGGQICPGGAVEVTGGSDQTFIFTPSEEYYYVNSIRVDGEVVDATEHGGGEAVEYTFTNIRANHTIDVHFAAAG